MREILFKAIQTDNGQWIEGVAFPHDNDKCTMFYQNPLDGTLEGKEVIPETVCQYVGMSDSKGQKVFENDIISVKGFSIPIDTENMRVIYDCRGRVSAIDKSGIFTWSGSSTFEEYEGTVIGNIFDDLDKSKEWKKSPCEFSYEETENEEEDGEW